MRVHLTAMIVLLLALPVAADPPRVSSFFPGGARRGETTRVEARGTFKSWPVEAWIDRPGVAFEAGEEPGSFTVTVAEDAPPGVCWVRLHNGEGAAPLRPFLIGTLPEVVEAEPNDADDQAQAIEAPAVVVNGRLQKAGDVDAFAVTLAAGQTLVAALEAHRRLGSPMDGVLQVVSPDGFVVDHVDDAPTLDPKLAFTAPTAGAYLVRVFAFPADPNSTIGFAGGDDYVYRLTLTTGGFLDLAHPSAVTDEDAPPVAPVGWNLPGEPAPLDLAPDPSGALVAWHEDLAGHAEVAVVDVPVVCEAGGDREPVALPAVLCGRIEAEGEVDSFPVRAPSGRSIAVRVAARKLGSPIDPVLQVLDADGKTLAEADDSRRSPDPEATVKVPDDGRLLLRVRDLHGLGGPDFVYRIEAREVAPDFALAVDTDHYALKPGTPLEIAIDVDRRDGFDRPIVVGADGLPEGVTAEPAVSEPSGDLAKKVTLRLSGADATPWSGPFRVVARTEDGERARSATTDRVGGSRTDSLWLSVLSE